MKFNLSKFEIVKNTRGLRSKINPANKTRGIVLSISDIKYIKDNKINISRLSREIIRQLRENDIKVSGDEQND